MPSVGGEAWVLGRSATPGVTEGARYSFSPSRLCPLETEQKAGVGNGKPDFSLRNQCCRRGCTSPRNPPLPDLLVALSSCERRRDFSRPCGARNTDLAMA